MRAEKIEGYITEYGNELFRFCCYLTGNKGKAEDLYQDTFLTALELQREVDKEAAKGFLVGIAANLWKNQWRKEKRRQKFITQTEIPVDEMSFQNEGKASEKEDPLDIVVNKETETFVQRIVNALPERYRLIVLMYYSAELTTAEIAKELHISKGTVTSRLLRARDKIKKGLEASGYER